MQLLSEIAGRLLLLGLMGWATVHHIRRIYDEVTFEASWRYPG